MILTTQLSVCDSQDNITTKKRFQKSNEGKQKRYLNGFRKLQNQRKVTEGNRMKRGNVDNRCILQFIYCVLVNNQATTFCTSP